ncbi:MAG: orotate phosphoribosyltransferase [Eubacteriales bacterium]|nr:orotate phosphoribosyltransferase [Eubacteriales bacterium]
MANIYTITYPKNENVFIHVMAGHFISANNHINYYVGTSDIKHNLNVSTQAAKLMAEYYSTNGIDVDTVLCLYETQALGAYLAKELSNSTMMAPNPDQTVFVVGSEYDAAGNLIFRDNLRRMIYGKNVVVLISCITSGRTVERAIESVRYYGGNVAGISSVFSMQSKISSVPVSSLFTTDDIPGYISYPSHDCPLCQKGVPVDAISNGYGYSKI